MADEADRSADRSGTIRQYAIAVGCVLGYPVLSQFSYHQYPLWSVEFALIIALVAGISAGLGALLPHCRLPVANAVLVLVVVVGLTVQFDLLAEGLLIALASAGLLAWLLRGQFATLLAPVFVALALGSFLDHWMDRQANAAVPTVRADPSLAPVIHIILDGFIGVDGLPGGEAGDAFRGKLVDFFRAHGFQLHARAYSRYEATDDSLNRALNFRSDAENLFQKNRLLHEGLRITGNAYLDRFREAGYVINVYQSEAVDFCRSPSQPADRCYTEAHPNARSLRAGVDDPVRRAQVLLKLLVSRSTVLEKLAQTIGVNPSWGISAYDRGLAEALAADLARGARGRVFLAHLLLPHSPFVRDADCTLDYTTPVWLRFDGFDGDIANTPESRGPRYGAYLEQAACALDVLDELFATLRELGIYEESTILVHGDHGSRLFHFPPRVRNLNRIGAGDLKDAFSILFALKMPKGGFTMNQQTIALDTLMERVSARIVGLPSDREPKPPFVYFSGTFPLRRLDIDIFEP